jgi:hypothetical protein
MADIADYKRKFGEAAALTKGLSGEIDKANKTGKLDRVTDAALGLGVGLTATAGIATKFAMDFDKQMSSVRAATHANAAEMDAPQGGPAGGQGHRLLGDRSRQGHRGAV